MANANLIVSLVPDTKVKDQVSVDCVEQGLVGEASGLDNEFLADSEEIDVHKASAESLDKKAEEADAVESLHTVLDDVVPLQHVAD